MRNLASPGDSQPLIASCWQFDLFSKMELTHHLFSTETFASPNTALMPSSPAASWLRNQQQQLSYVGCRPKTCEVDAQERRRRARALLEQAALWSPSPNEKTRSSRQWQTCQIWKIHRLLAGEDHQTQTSNYPQLSQSRGAPRRHQLSE